MGILFSGKYFGSTLLSWEKLDFIVYTNWKHTKTDIIGHIQFINYRNWNRNRIRNRGFIQYKS